MKHTFKKIYKSVLSSINRPKDNQVIESVKFRPGPELFPIIDEHHNETSIGQEQLEDIIDEEEINPLTKQRQDIH